MFFRLVVSGNASRLADWFSLLASAMSAGLMAVKRGGATAPREAATGDRYQDLANGHQCSL
jgi:hypothetical protein